MKKKKKANKQTVSANDYLLIIIIVQPLYRVQFKKPEIVQVKRIVLRGRMARVIISP